MSDFDVNSRYEELVEGNPKVDRSRLEEAQEAVTKLRRAGLAPRRYEIDSPYERGPVEAPVSIAEDDDSEPALR